MAYSPLTRWLTPGTAEIRISGRPWRVIFTHRALLVAEEECGAADILNAGIASAKLGTMRALLRAAVDEAGADCDPESIGEAVSKIGVPEAQRLLVRAWEASMPDPEIESKRPKKKPRKNSVEAALMSNKPENATWIQAWAQARGQHGLTDEEWLSMTPRMYRELGEVRLDRLRREEFFTGTVASTTANFSMSPPKKALSPRDFMINKYPEPEPLSVGEQLMAHFARARRGS